MTVSKDERDIPRSYMLVNEKGAHLTKLNEIITGISAANSPKKFTLRGSESTP